MPDKDPLRPALLAAILTGGILVAVLSFTGGVWENAPSERSRAYLVYANGTAFSGFLAASVLYVCGLMGAKAGPLHSSITNLLSSLVLIATIAVVGEQLGHGMDAWFTNPPAFPEGLTRTVRILTMAAMGWFAASVIFGGVTTVMGLIGDPDPKGT